MSKFKRTIKQIGRQVWEFFKASVPASLMYFCAGTVLMMLTLKMDEDTETANLIWDNTKLLWTIVCIAVAAAYDGLISYAQGGQGYEMLVSGNMKRMSSDIYGGELKISSHKFAKEYREWKGFAIGGFMALFPIVVGILFGVNQTAIDNQKMGTGLAVVLLIGFLLSGWSVLPFYYLNASGHSISYFVSILFALVPIIVTGVMYIVGAYGKRAKTIKAQELADRAAAAEANKTKKINYGGLPGTKPKKRKK